MTSWMGIFLEMNCCIDAKEYGDLSGIKILILFFFLVLKVRIDIQQKFKTLLQKPKR